MADIIAQLELLARDRGCHAGLTGIVDPSLCPRINLDTGKSTSVEEKRDFISVTPTEVSTNTCPHTVPVFLLPS